MAMTQEPLVITPEDATIPVETGRFLKAWHWRSRAPRGVLAVSHGLGEHAGVYRSFAEYLVPTLGIDVLGVDLLGHGRSPGRRGHLNRYDDLLDDLHATIRWIARERPGLPRFVLGHSNGGLVAIGALLRDPDAAEGVILTNPALRLKYKAPRHKLAIGHLLRLAAPWLTLSGPLPAEGLTRDPLQQLLLRTDRLLHNRLGAPLFFGMRDAGIAALERAGEQRSPLLLVLGADDPIIDPVAGRAYFDRYGAADKTLLDLPGFRHDPLFEQDRGVVYRSIADWLAPRLAAPTEGDRLTPGVEREVRV